MTYDYLFELQKALMAALYASANLQKLVNGIYCYKPDNASFPYMSVESVVSKDMSTRQVHVIHAAIAINAYSNERDSEELVKIMTEIKTVLESGKVSPTGCRIVAVEEEDSSIIRIANNRSWQGKLRYIVSLQKSSDALLTKAKDVLISISNSVLPVVSYTQLGGIKEVSLSFTSKNIDATNLSSGKWRELLARGGMSHLNISGYGYFSSSFGEQMLFQQVLSGEVANYQIDLGNRSRLEGRFSVAAYKRDAGANLEQEFFISLESSGEVRFLKSGLF